MKIKLQPTNYLCISIVNESTGLPRKDETSEKNVYKIQNVLFLTFMIPCHFKFLTVFSQSLNHKIIGQLEILEIVFS